MIPQVVATGNLTTVGSTVQTTSFTPPANGLLVVLASIRQGGGNDRRPCTLTGHGLEWTLLGSRNEVVSGELTQVISSELYVATVGGSPTAGTLTATWTGNGATLQTTVFALDGQHATSPTPQAVSSTVDTAIDGSGDVTLPLGSAPAAASTVIGFATPHLSSGAVDPAAAAFTEFYDFAPNTNLRHQAMYDAEGAGTNVVWTGLFGRIIFFAVEVAAAAGLAAPTGLTEVAKTSTSVTLGWDAATGAEGYDVERDLVVVASDVAGTQYEDTGLDPATGYSYRVRSVAYS